MFRRLILRIAARAIVDDEIIDALNRKLDLPGLDEEAERALISTVISALADVLAELGSRK